MITSYNEFLNESNNEWTINDPEYYGITNYSWNDGFLDVDGDVKFSIATFPEIPFKFGKVEGKFDPSFLGNITNLINCPYYIKGTFYCRDNPKLTSLEHFPKYIGGSIICIYNKSLKSLDGCPKEVFGGFNCNNNKSLKTLNGGPMIVHGDYNCSDNKLLKNLEHCPKRVDGRFLCKYLPKLIGIEDYPRCIIKGGINNLKGSADNNKYNFQDVYQVVSKNEEIFEKLLDDKIAFHQMVMRLNPDLIQYYKTIPPPPKKTIL